MGSPSYMQSIIDQNDIMRQMTVCPPDYITQETSGPQKYTLHGHLLLL